MYNIPGSLPAEISNFATLIDDFKLGKVEPVQFKGTRVPMGIYEQRQDGTYMVRIRCTGGYISPQQLRQVALTAESHQSDLLHITTRQEIQIHNILIDQVKTILPELLEVGLSSKGGGGNTVRNILVDINSGITNQEVFDVLPYAMDLTSRLIAEPDSFSLPRKLKIAFSTSEATADFALINDLGFIAKIKNGKRGFRVYLGGSVASNPTLGWELFDFAPEEELFNIAIAAKRFFSNHGNRKNKHKARIRYIFYKEGEQNAKEQFFNYYLEIKSGENIVYSPVKLAFENKIPAFKPLCDDSSEFRTWKKRYVSPQKQIGLFSSVIPFVNGNSSSDTLLKIADFADAFGNDVLRFTLRQQLQLRNIPGSYIANLYALLKELNIITNLPFVINNIVSCTGADTCRLGICYSKGASLALRTQFAKSKLNLDQVSDLRINISGCPNSCAQQIWSDIGFSGRVGRNDRMYPAYNVFVGARTGENPQFGDLVGSISAYDLPGLTQDILEGYLRVKDRFSTFRGYLDEGGKAQIIYLIKKYKKIPSFSEDKNYYYDWGSDELFSLANKGPAECSAGLFDMIDVDLNLIKHGFKRLTKEDNRQKINEILYDIVFSSCRMLLITKGIEPKNRKESFEYFIEKFIKSGLVPRSFKDLVEIASQNSEYDFSSRREDVINLANTVTSLYESMDDSLQFKNQESKTSDVKPQASKDENKIRVRDFRGVPCPMNFVKTKIELASLKTSDLLEIWLDDGQPIQNVPGSVRSEGHEIKSLIQDGSFWKVLIKKV